MRRILVALVLFAALPLSAQRWGSSSRVGGSVSIHSNSGFGSHRGFGGGGVRIGGGISFGHNPRVGVFVNSRPFGHVRRWTTYPYSYSPAYVYPYAVYPSYPLAYYNAYDYTPTPVQPVYVYDYASGGDNNPDVGLAEQMRQQRVGIYSDQYPNRTSAIPAPSTTAVPTPRASAAMAPPPERETPATVLVYRDGQRTEVRNYGIVGQTLWIFSEQRAQKVDLSLLDLDATRKANEERGVEFVVPQK